jgi:uncharacterized protein (DUF1330 family)
MPAYAVFIRDEPPRDPAGLAIYQKMNSESVSAYLAYGIKPIVVYGAIEALEGGAPDGTIILQFPSMADAKAWYESPEYQNALQYRLKAANYRAFLMEGL